jgi:endonuclease/exonuclease/phosphatase family metal-dependent hydrolase
MHSFFPRLGPPAPKFTHNVGDDYKDQRLNSFIENYLDKYDVVCLQEMFGAFSRRRRKLIRAARKRGFYWKISSPQRRSSLYLVDGGCIILSKVRMTSTASIIFPPGASADRLAAKGVIYAKLNPKPGIYVHLFVTHLQAVYSNSESGAQCQAIQNQQYLDLVEFVADTVAANETHDDMLTARRLMEKRNRIAPPRTRSGSAPGQDSMSYLSQKCRRWPILIAGDFNCNSRHPAGDVSTKTTKQFMDLSLALSKLGAYSDILHDNLGEHPVTYAAADFSIDGSFSPRETALTHPDDYHESGQFVNQSLDYLFLFPPSYEEIRLATGIVSTETSPAIQPVLPAVQPDHMDSSPTSPDSRSLKGSLVRPVDVIVRHLEYVPNKDPKAPTDKVLKYLSDHMAIETVFTVANEY